MRLRFVWILGVVLIMPSCMSRHSAQVPDECGDDACERAAGRTTAWRADATWAGRGGEGAPLAVWRLPVGGDDTAAPRIEAIQHALPQVYNLCWTSDIALSDLELGVRFQARSGLVDQGGGVIWRVQDRDHYYLCRANPLEDNLRVYKVIGGVRTLLASLDHPMTPATPDRAGAWHQLRVRHVGDRMVCEIDGSAVLEVTDTSLKQPGGIGLWTKADAVTWFDCLRVSPASYAP